MNKKFWAASFTLSGTIIGAGILGLPFVFGKSGFLIGLAWLIFLGALMAFVNLTLAEVTLRTKGKHQLSGYAEKYLGKCGKKIMFLAMIIGVYSALIAYLLGEGQSLSKVLPGNINPLILAIIFWLIMTILLREGLRGLKRIGTWGVVAIIVLIFVIFIRFLPDIKPQNLLVNDFSNFALPIGVILFALLGFTSIPEVRQELYSQEKLFKKAVIVGSIVPIILYTIFTLTFVGVLGSNINRVATLSFGNLINLLGIFTMLPPFFVLSYALKDTFKYDLKTSKLTNFFFTSIVPLALYLIIALFNLADFILIMSIGGIISAGITGTLILIISKIAKKQGNRKSEINMPLNKVVIFILAAIFIIGAILEFII